MWPAAANGLAEPLTGGGSHGANGSGVARRASADAALWSRSPTSPIYPKLSPALNGRPGGALEANQQVLVVSVDGATDEQLSTNLQTGFNLINNYVGMVLLSMSYCFACCGWAALPLLALLTAYGGYTGSLIVMSYCTISREGETVPSYAKIGERACGSFGKWLVLVSSVIETIFAVVGMNVIVWQNAALLLPKLQLQSSALLCILVSFPFNWLKNFSLLSFVSAFGFLCVLLICTVAGYQMSARGEDSATVEHSLVKAEGLPMAASIMLAGLTGHVSLPPMYCSMANPSDFHRTLAVSFAIMFIMYGWVGACGYAVFGDAGSVLLTSDMDAAKHGGLDDTLVALVLGGISFKLFCSVPMCIVVLTDIGETLWLERKGTPLGEQAVLQLRIALWTVCTLAAVASYTSLQYLTAFIGVNSMLISVLLPILFYVLIHRDAMSNLEAIWFTSLFVLSCGVTLFLSYIDVADFLKSLQSDD